MFFNHIGNPTGIAPLEKITGLREVSEVGSKSHEGPGLRFIMVSVSDLISETLGFSSLPFFFPCHNSAELGE